MHIQRNFNGGEGEGGGGLGAPSPMKPAPIYSILNFYFGGAFALLDFLIWSKWCKFCKTGPIWRVF